MQFNLKELNKLERSLEVTIPAEDLEKSFQAEVDKIAPKIKMDGYRPGKVPAEKIRQVYGNSLWANVIDEKVRTAFMEVVEKEKLEIVGHPHFDLNNYKVGTNSPLKFTATFEVYPEIKFVDLAKLKVEKPVATITDSDVDEVIEKLRKQSATWREVSRGALKGDRVTVDIEGEIKDEINPELTRKDFLFELGAGLMRDDFEENIFDAKAGAALKFKIKYPKDYFEEKLAGNKVQFKVLLKKVEEAELPPLDEKFFEKMGIKEGGADALRKEIRENLERHLAGVLINKFKENLLDKLVDEYPVDLPKIMVEKELKRLQDRQAQYKEHFAKMAGTQREQLSTELPNVYSDEKLKDIAKRNSSLSLLFQKIILDLKINPDPTRIRKKIEEFAAGYDKKAEAIEWYYKNKSALDHVTSLVLEEQVVEEMQKRVKAVENQVSYKEAVNEKSKK